MVELSRDDLFTLEEYSEKRSSFRSGVLDEKKNRGVMVGNHVHLIFENKNTIQYQVQEMLRIEKIFEAKDIQEELDAYNPLIPDGKNLKATMLIEYVDVEIRREELTKLKGIERNVWFKVGDTEKVYGIADEDLEREDDTKTSAVHFMRFEFNETQPLNSDILMLNAEILNLEALRLHFDILMLNLEILIFLILRPRHSIPTF